MKNAVITGATSGIGLAAAMELAQRGVRVAGIGRSQEKCEAAKAQIEASATAPVEFFLCDLAHQAQVNRVADEIAAYLDAECGGALDALINNAGGIRNWYTTTPEGYETQFALNHLAGFLLTHRMLPCLKRGDGRVILTGSGSHKYMKMRWNDVMFEKRYRCLMAYKQSKVAGMLFAAEFNRRYTGEGLRAYVVDPGLVNTDIGSKNTSGFISWFWHKRQKHGVAPKVSAQTYAYLCKKTPEPEALYYYQCKPAKYSRYVDNETDAKRLFELSERLCGIAFGESGGEKK